MACFYSTMALITSSIPLSDIINSKKRVMTRFIRIGGNMDLVTITIVHVKWKKKLETYKHFKVATCMYCVFSKRSPHQSGGPTFKEDQFGPEVNFCIISTHFSHLSFNTELIWILHPMTCFGLNISLLSHPCRYRAIAVIMMIIHIAFYY